MGRTRKRNSNNLRKNSNTIVTRNFARSEITNTTVQDRHKMAQNTPNIETILQTIPCYDGKKERNIEFYIKQYDELADAANLEERLKLILLKAKLSGEARETLINSMELNEEDNYATFKRKLIEEFRKKDTFEEAQDKFLSIKQEPAQTIDDFVKIFNIAASKYIQKSGHAKKEGAVEFLNTLKKTKFLDAIRPDISFEVRKNGPKTFEESVEIAKKIESAFKSIPKETINTNSSSEENNFTETLKNLTKLQTEEITKLKEQINNLKMMQEEKQETKQKFCAICEKTNHMTQQCYYNLKTKQNYKRAGPSRMYYHNAQAPMMQNYNQAHHCSNYQQQTPITNSQCCSNNNQHSTCSNNAQNFSKPQNSTRKTNSSQYRTNYKNNSNKFQYSKQKKSGN